MRSNVLRVLLFAGVFALGLSLAGIAGASSHRGVSKQVLVLQKAAAGVVGSVCEQNRCQIRLW